MQTKHVVSLFLINRENDSRQRLDDLYVRAKGPDDARKEAQAAVEKMGYRVRTVSFSTDGRILVYTEGKEQNKRKRSIAASTLGVS